jgi:hypothetical protein
MLLPGAVFSAANSRTNGRNAPNSNVVSRRDIRGRSDNHCLQRADFAG